MTYRGGGAAALIQISAGGSKQYSDTGTLFLGHLIRPNLLGPPLLDYPLN